MTSSAAQHVLIDVSDPLPEPVPPVVAEDSAAVAGDDGLPPPTKAQLFYWRQLAGEVHQRGAAGLRDEEWPPDLAPQPHTLRQLVERCILVRRGRAWHLRRHWYARLMALRARAVDSPPLTLAERPAPDLPTYAELEVWEALCRWLDLQPKQRAQLPFLSLMHDAPAPALIEGGDARGEAADGHLRQTPACTGEQQRQLLIEQAGRLRSMRRFRLVRHLSTCEWALSPKWRDQLHSLWQGVHRALREYSPPQLAPAAPRSLCAGLDTWGLNWLVEEQALPARLRRDLDDLQQQAQHVEQEVETPWVYDGAPLRLYQTGVRPKNGKGVSWSYVLVNPSLRLLVRRVPLGGVVANARLGSECLWRRTPRAALDELHALIHRLWGKDVGRWQVSYAHLAHDVANAPLEREQLDRYVSRSRRRAIYEATQAELRRMLRETRASHSAFGAAFEDADEDEDMIFELGYDWEGEFAGEEELLLADPFAEEGDAWEQTPHGSRAAQTQARETLDEECEKRACHAYVWGKRLSGVAFSPGGAVSFVMYRKDWEGRLKSKRHMEPIWTAAGWDGKEPVTRHEARLVREPIRELHLVGVAASVLDDPWQFLDHEHEVWAAIVGRSDSDTCPDAVDVAWIRRVVPREGESNRSRWDTDPVWWVVQQASFTPPPLAARRMIRRRQRQREVKQLDRQLLGVLKKREALLQPDPSGRDVTLALREVVVPLERELAARGEQFDQAVRAKRQACGLPVPLSGRVLPLRPVLQPEEVDAHHQLVRDLEERIPAALTAPRPAAAVLHAEAGSIAAGWVGRTGGQGGQGWKQRTGAPDGVAGGHAAGGEAADVRWERWTWLRARSAEVRMREAYHALEEAELQGRSSGDLDRLERAYLRAVDAWSAARRMWSALLGDAAAAGDGGHRRDGPPVY